MGLEPLGEFADGSGGCRGIDNDHAGLLAQQLSGQIGFGIDADQGVLGAEHLQGRDQRLVTGQHDQAFAGRYPLSWPFAHDRRSRKIMHFGLLERYKVSAGRNSHPQAE